MPRPASIYTVSDETLSQVDKLVSQEPEVGLKHFAIAIINAAREETSKTIDRESLVNALKEHTYLEPVSQKLKTLGFKNGIISKRVKELVSLGCLTIEPELIYNDGRARKANVHKLIDLRPLISHLKTNPKKSPESQGRPKKNDLVVHSELLNQGGLIKLEADGDVIPYTESAFGILEVAARSRSDNESEVRCRYFLKKDDYLDITAATSSREGAGIMYSSDQRVIHTLNGMLKMARASLQGDIFMDEQPVKFVGEYCFFDVYALTKEIGLAANMAENRANVIKMIERLKDTTFSVDATNSETWRTRYMPHERFNKADYRYITEFYSAEDWAENSGTEVDKPLIQDRYFVVKFHELIYRAMVTPRYAFLAHESLKRERLDIVHRLNNFVKPVVGVRDKGLGNDHHQYTVDTFHRRVRPTSRLDNFERQFMIMIARQDKREDETPHEESVRFKYDENGKIIPEGVAWLNGYYYKLEMNEELAQEIYRKTRTVRTRRYKQYPVITIWRDRKDEVVGDESSHNRALRRQMHELEVDGETY